MAPKPKPGQQVVVVVDGDPGLTATQEQQFIRGYTNQGYSLLYIRQIQEEIIVPSGITHPIDNCTHIKISGGLRYYFVK